MSPIVISSFVLVCIILGTSSIQHQTVPELIRLKGYPCEEHWVTTKDGYVLAMHRIPWGKNGKGKGKFRPPVILQHGLFSSSASWTLNLPHETPAYLFADKGYDVWLTNIRGGEYSKNHTHLSSSSKEFWNFSWDEMAKYDLPRFIDYILKHTKQKKLDYVGHSMGTTIFFALMSTKTEYNAKIKDMYALAPVATVSHIQTYFKYFCRYGSWFKYALDIVGDYEVIPNRNSILIKLFTFVCNEFKITRVSCENLLFMIVGFDSSEFDSKWMPIVNDELLTGTSIDTVMHFSQEYEAGRFQHFDYGSAENYKRYRQIAPPEYEISKVTAPVHLLWGMNDYLADDADVQLLIKDLPNVKSIYPVPLKQFNHLDFLWAKDMKTLVYDPIFKMMKGYRIIYENRTITN